MKQKSIKKAKLSKREILKLARSIKMPNGKVRRFFFKLELYPFLLLYQSHNYLRRINDLYLMPKISWYRKWHQRPHISFIHKAFLLVFLSSFLFFILADFLLPGGLFPQKKPALAAANTATWTTKGDFETGTTRTNVDTVTPSGNGDIRLSFVVSATIPVGSSPQSVAVNPTTNKIYVANQSSNNVSVIDGNTNTVLTTIPVGSYPWGIGVNPTTNKIYVAIFDNVSVIDGNTDTVLTTIPVGSYPRGIGVNPITNKIYVANQSSNNVSVIDGNTDTVLTSIPVGVYPQGATVNPITNKIYVANQSSNNVSVIDGNTDTVLTSIPVGVYPQDAVVNSTTNKIYVANYSSGNVSIIDGADNNVSATVIVGSNPRGISVNSTTNKIYVANYSSGNVSIIDGADNNVSATVIVGSNPRGISVNSTTNRIYVANYGNNNVSVITNEYYPSGTISGLKINAGDGVKAKWDTISWTGTTPANTAIKFRTRGADTEADLALATWSDYYTTSGSSITTALSQWLEIEMTLESTDELNTPTLNDVTLSYDTLENPPLANMSIFSANNGTFSSGGTEGTWTKDITINLNVPTASLTCTGCGISTNRRTQIEVVATGQKFNNSGTVGTNYFEDGGTGDRDGTVNGVIVCKTESRSGWPVFAAGSGYHWRARSVDNEGRVSGWTSYGLGTDTAPAVADFTIDQTPPIGTASINNNAQYTNSTNVTLNLSASDADSKLGKLYLSNNEADWTDKTPASDFVGQASYSGTVDWTLTSGDGTKIVYVQLRDNAENVFPVPNLINIGTQTWMKYNMNVGTRIDGTSTQTNNGIIEKYCYNNDEANCTTYGGLYQWGEAMQHIGWIQQGICPTGFHIPTDAEYKTLEMYLGMTQEQADATGWRGTDQGTKLKPGGASGFNGLLAGTRISNGSFSALGESGWFWPSPAYWRKLSSDYTTVFRSVTYELNGFSVRCLANNDTIPAIYSSIILDTQAPSAFSPSSPEDGLKTNNTSPTFSWTPSSDENGLSKYQLWVNNNLLQDNIPSNQTQTTIETPAGVNTWFIRAIDNAGNFTDSNSFTLTIDTIPPTGSILINNNAQYTNNLSVTLSISANDTGQSGLASYELSSNGTAWEAPVSISGNSYSNPSVPWTLTSGDGTKTVYIRFKDNAGNNSGVWTQTTDSDFNTAGSVKTNVTVGNNSITLIPTITIGTQTWMRKNMNVGTKIAGTSNQTNNSYLEKYCYNNDENNCTTYGGLYQWDEMMQYSTTPGAQGICPSGFHIPTDAEWKTLEMYLGMTQDQADAAGWRGTDQGTQLKPGGSSGFEGLLAGIRGTYGDLYGLGSGGLFWTSSKNDLTSAWNRYLDSGNAKVNRYYNHKSNGYSVRCLSNSGPDGSFISSVRDNNTGVSYGKISWSADIPTQSGPDALRFQIASNNDNSTWDYKGPDGDTNTYYTASDTQIWSSHNVNRYIRYKAFLHTDDMGYIPTLNDVTIESANNDSIILDQTAPSNISNFTAKSGVNTLENNQKYSFTNLTFSWDQATDNLSGIKGYKYFFGTPVEVLTSGSLETASTSVSVNITDCCLNQEKTYYFRVTPIDNAGNLYSDIGDNQSTFTYIYDTIAPGVPVNLSVSPSSWTNQNTFTFSWNPPADTPKEEIDVYYWKLNSDPAQTGLDPAKTVAGDLETQEFTFDILLQGENIFYLVAKDKAGNVKAENRALIDFYYDSVSPTVSNLAVSSGANWTQNKEGVNVSLSFAVSDPGALATPPTGSGIDQTYLSIDSNNPVDFVTDITSPYILPKDLSDGEHTLYLKTKDITGNASSISNIVVKIDNTSPDPFTPQANPASWTNTNPQITFSTTDTHSGIDYYQLKIDNGSYSTQESGYVLPSLSDGEHTVYVKAIDKAQNSREGSVKVYIDKTKPAKPVDLSANPSTWTNNNNFSFSWVVPEDLSGIAGYYYIIDTIPSESNKGTFVDNSTQAGNVATIPNLQALQEGENTFYLYAKDNAGNEGIDVDTVASVKFYFDQTPPLSFAPQANPSNWTNTNPQITFSATDTHSGIDYYELKIDDSAYSTQTSGYVLPSLSDGEYTVYVKAIDRAGNSREGSVKVYTDKTAPSAPTLTCTNYANNDWTNASSSSTCSITDTATPSPRTATAYSTDNGSSWPNNANSLSLSFTPSEGTNNVIMRISDTGGGPINSNTYIIKVDRTAPLTTETFDNTKWYNSNQTINLSANDATSGVSKTYFKVNNGSPQEGTTANITTEGNNNTIEYWSTDVAGNSEIHKTKSGIKLDKTKPSTTNSAFSSDWTKDNVSITLTASDPAAAGGASSSGVKDTFYSLDSSTPSLKYTGPITLSTSGIYTLRYYSTDNAGNQESVKDGGQVRIDKDPPSVPVNLKAQPQSLNQITLLWDASLDPPAIGEASSGLKDYQLFQSQDNLSFTLLATLLQTTYSDLNLTPNTTYYYKVLSRDNLNNTSNFSEVASAKTQDYPIPGPPLISSVILSPDQTILTISGVTIPDADVTLEISSDPYLFTFSSDASGYFSFALNLNDYPLSPGKHLIRSKVRNKATGKESAFSSLVEFDIPASPAGGPAPLPPAPIVNQVVDTVKKATQSVTNAIANTLSGVSSALQNIIPESVKAIVQSTPVQATITASAVAVAAIPSVVAPALSGAASASPSIITHIFFPLIDGINHLFAYLYYAFTSLMYFLGIWKKPKKWGTVYDAVTKKPIPLSFVKLFGRHLETRVTDKDGRFGFFAPKGTYNIIVAKPGFNFPSSRVTLEDYPYSDIYYGKVFVLEKEQKIHYDIPVDPMTEEKRIFSLNRSLSSVRVNLTQPALIFSALGLVYSLIVFFLELKLLNFAILLVITTIFTLNVRNFIRSKEIKIHLR